jgi:glucose/arabinose dehydrogenase
MVVFPDGTSAGTGTACGFTAPQAPGGYQFVAGDGGVFSFGDASFHGSSGTPALTVAAVETGLTIPWDVAFTPDGTMLMTERGGRLLASVAGQRRVLAAPAGVVVAGEAGMMGLAVDPGFASNRRIYVCTAWQAGGVRDIRVQSWTVDPGYATATVAQDGLVTGIPLTSGLHAGCRLLIGPDGALWIGTGDAHTGTNPQDLSSLGGKVLRVDPATGAPLPGDIQGPVHDFGHRNVQGLAVQPGTNRVFSVEQGTDRDDEVNILSAGANYGWDPVPGYDESTPMTDLDKFPDALAPVWASGFPTIATSGGAFLRGPHWQAWDGQLVVAALKGAQLRLLVLDPDGRLVAEQPILQGRDRLRSVTLGPEGRLYVTTSNGGGADEVLEVSAG